MGLVGLETFAGAGGMAVGANMAGVRVMAAVELDRHAADTYAYNHPSTLVIEGDVQHIANIRFKIPHGDSLVLFGGPPCQGFSTSNQRTRSADNLNNWLFKEFCKLLKALKPEFVVFENVRGITETEGGLFVKEVIQSIEDAGYKTVSGLLNAAHFGVPQNRTRFFVIGRRGKRPPPLPIGNPDQVVTVSEALDDLPILANGASENVLPYAAPACSSFARAMRDALTECTGHLVTNNAPHILERYKYIPQGGNWEDVPKHLMTNYADVERCHTGIYRRLSADLPSVVIGNFRKNMLIHPSQNRGLSVREAARLQSFPDHYVFRGSIGFQQQQVGNAVPPLLAKAVFEAIAQSG